jgi:hypothetical protein
LESAGGAPILSETVPGFISIQKRRAFEFRALSIGICNRPPRRARNDKSAQPGGLKQTGLRGLSSRAARGTVARHSWGELVGGGRKPNWVYARRALAGEKDMLATGSFDATMFRGMWARLRALLRRGRGAFVAGAGPPARFILRQFAHFCASLLAVRGVAPAIAEIHGPVGRRG